MQPMLRLRWTLVPLLLLALVVTAACGGGDSKEDPTVIPTPSGPPLSEEDYLRQLCTGLTGYQDALMTAKSGDDIAATIQQFVDSMAAVSPPADLREWHIEFVRYLEDGLDDPTSLSTLPPPELDKDTTDRLALKTQDIAECKYPTFLDRPDEDPESDISIAPTPTP